MPAASFCSGHSPFFFPPAFSIDRFVQLFPQVFLPFSDKEASLTVRRVEPGAFGKKTKKPFKF